MILLFFSQEKIRKCYNSQPNNILLLKYCVSDQTSVTSAIGAIYKLVFFNLWIATHKV